LKPERLPTQAIKLYAIAMESINEDLDNSRFFDFKKRPYDAVNPGLAYQFWPAFQSKLKRKGLSSVLDLQFHPAPA
jgi:hypothetical protein